VRYKEGGFAFKPAFLISLSCGKILKTLRYLNCLLVPYTRCNLLVLARRKEESIIIGDNIVVTILGVEGEKVKLGIEAPNDVRIWRKEIYEAITEQTKIAEKIAVASAEPTLFQSLRDLLESEIKQDDTPKPEHKEI
jgi:carbon storage regulator